jgi:hypothetical protein
MFKASLAILIHVAAVAAAAHLTVIEAVIIRDFCLHSSYTNRSWGR